MFAGNVVEGNEDGRVDAASIVLKGAGDGLDFCFASGSEGGRSGRFCRLLDFAAVDRGSPVGWGVFGSFWSWMIDFARPFGT